MLLPEHKARQAAEMKSPPAKKVKSPPAKKDEITTCKEDEITTYIEGKITPVKKAVTAAKVLKRKTPIQLERLGETSLFTPGVEHLKSLLIKGPSLCKNIFIGHYGPISSTGCWIVKQCKQH